MLAQARTTAVIVIPDDDDAQESETNDPVGTSNCEDQTRALAVQLNFMGAETACSSPSRSFEIVLLARFCARMEIR